MYIHSKTTVEIKLSIIIIIIIGNIYIDVTVLCVCLVGRMSSSQDDLDDETSSLYAASAAGKTPPSIDEDSYEYSD